MNEIVQHTQPNVPAINEAESVMGMILKAGDNIDPIKLEKLMDLHERMLNRQAKEAFSLDFVRMKPHLPRVARTKDNTQTKSKYAPLENINDVVDPILEQYGFGTATKIISQTAESVTVKAELWHKGGHIEETTIMMPLDNKGMAGTVNKTLPHAVSSSVTYAKRVAICALLNISTGDDKDGNVPPVIIDTEQAATLDTLIRQTGADKKAFLEYFKVDDVRNIKTIDYATAFKMLNKKPKTVSAA